MLELYGSEWAIQLAGMEDQPAPALAAVAPQQSAPSLEPAASAESPQLDAPSLEPVVREGQVREVETPRQAPAVDGPVAERRGAQVVERSVRVLSKSSLQVERVQVVENRDQSSLHQVQAGRHLIPLGPAKAPVLRIA